ncbi:hypothetical protein UT4_03510 [Ferrigenium sp. UT4]
MRLSCIMLILLAPVALQGCFPVIAVGAGSGAMMATDRRTSGTYVEDEAIENKALLKIGEQYKEKVHLNVTSFNRTVLLTGEVPNELVKVEIGKHVAAIDNVRKVINELGIGEPSTLTSRSNDTLLTSKVKFGFLNNKRFRATDIKIVTENEVVYLLGLVKRAEADAAAESARTTAGIKKVVRVFEYLD